MLYQISDATVTVGAKTVLSHLYFTVKGKEKIALVGCNGAGKTTLLRLIAGELDLDRDDKRKEPGITSSRKLTIGMLNQNNSVYKEKTAEEILLENAWGKEIFSEENLIDEQEYDRLFTGFGFAKEEKKRKFSSFSGGEQTKILLIRLLLMKPDILLLDEPTNHLDIPSAEWLEKVLTAYEKAVIVVSHDRFFLDQVADVVYELENGKAKRYAGNYTYYRQQKRKDREVWKNAYERQQGELKRLENLVERFKHKPRKAAFARSRKTIAGRMERIEKPAEENIHWFTEEILPEVSGSKWVFEAEHLKIGYEQVIAELSLRIRRGQKIGIIGSNGAGKTTFLKTAAGIIPPLSGKCSLGKWTTLGYFDQHSASIESDKSVIEHFHDRFPSMTQKEIRSVLGMYLFRGEKAFAKVSALSGGEKARLVLAEILHWKPNFLILDEPTSHMDIQAKETLESAFLAYKGTILFVSHDRYFIRQVADAILLFEGDSVMYYPFGYDHYLERCKKGKGSKLSAEIRAEDQALIEGIRAVPKADQHRIKEENPEEAYTNWRIRIAEEEMEKAKNTVEKLWEKQRQIREESWKRWAENPKDEKNAGKEDPNELWAFCLAWDSWTESCLDWYEDWCELSSSSFTAHVRHFSDTESEAP